jgi:3-hydroxyisobutyrate dehydrogenase
VTSQQRRNFSAASKQQPIGFIGLGHMGGHMALVVFDLNPAALDKISAQAKALNLTATAAKTPRDVGLQVSTLITMLPSSPHVRDVYTKPDGVLRGIKANSKALLIDSSTIAPQTARDVAKEAEGLGAIMVDAPVSGGVGGAEAGTLTFMVGGSEEAFNLAKPVLQRMGKNIVHCGPTGTGQVAKVCNNVVLGMSMVAVAEGMSLGVKLGADPKTLAGIFNVREKENNQTNERIGEKYDD